MTGECDPTGRFVGNSELGTRFIPVGQRQGTVSVFDLVALMAGNVGGYTKLGNYGAPTWHQKITFTRRLIYF